MWEDLAKEGVEIKFIMDLKSKDKKSVLKELLEQTNLNEIKKQLVLNSLLNREKIGTTGFGNHIAIPHTRSLAVKRIYLIIGKSKEGINFESVDNKPVNLIFLLIAPPIERKPLYLLLLGKIAKLCQKIIEDDFKCFNISEEEEFKKYLENLMEGEI